MHSIAVLPGDGIGEEVVQAALRVLEAVSAVTGTQYKLEHYPYGAEHYLKSGETFPESALRAMRDHSAILLGAIGDPRVETGFLEREIIAGVRFGLDLYINLRPIKLFDERLCPLKDKRPDEIDMVIVRENTEGAYAGMHGFCHKGQANEVATQTMIYSRMGVERAIRYAFEIARTRDKKKQVTLIDKANAVRAHDIWTRTFAEVSQDFPDVSTDHAYVDAACMWMIKNPQNYDVLVAENMFGDIISDLCAGLVGGLGFASAANIGDRYAVFEPTHGSAPKYAGQYKVNPMAMLLAVKLMFDWLGEAELARRLEDAIGAVIRDRRVGTYDVGMSNTSLEVAQEVAREVTGKNQKAEVSE